jgi:uncharacterized membrane protein
MTVIHESIEVEVPVSVAYNQWTQFEEFPSFMDGVKEVRQLDDTHLHWVVEIGGTRQEWDAEIIAQEPDQRIAWRATDGKDNGGEVRFSPLGDRRTSIEVELHYEPEGLKEQLGSMVGIDERRVKADLERFKELVELRARESGAWRGEVRAGQVIRR